MMGMSDPASLFGKLNRLRGLTYTKGYVNASGTINQPDATQKEVCSELFENRFSTDKHYVIFQLLPVLAQGWVGFGLYDNNGKFRQRISFDVSSSSSREIGDNKYLLYFNAFTVPYSDGLVRFSCRSYGAAGNLMFAFEDIPDSAFASIDYDSLA